MLAETYFFGDNGAVPYRIMKTIGRRAPVKEIRATVTELVNEWKQNEHNDGYEC